ncbi:hypothetical protein ES705_05040 [subsurface metagenome]
MDRLAKALKVIDALSEHTGKLFSFLVLAMVFFEVLETIARYGFSAPTTWSWELVTLLYGALFIMGGAWVLQTEGHVRTDFLYRHLSPKAKAYLDLVLFTTIFFTFAGVMIWQAGRSAVWALQVNEKTFTMWAPPFYPFRMLLVVAFALLGVQGLAKWIRDLVFVTTGRKI